MIVQPVVEPMDQFAALVSAVDNSQQLENKTAEEDFWLSHGTAPSSRRQSQAVWLVVVVVWPGGALCSANHVAKF